MEIDSQHIPVAIGGGQKVKSGSIQAVVHRCQHAAICETDGRARPCAECVAVNLGTVSYYSANPIQMALWELKQAIKAFKTKLRGNQ
jgi:hypothetical protein